VILTLLSSAIAFAPESEISEIQKCPKCCRKILKSAKTKSRNNKIELNWMKLSFTIAKHPEILSL
jgi:hypothetical protein